MALPGPEVLAPIGLGLVQLVTLIWLSLNLRKISRTLKKAFKILMVMALVYTFAYPLVLLLSGIYNPSDALPGFTERKIHALSSLPQDLTTAKVAPAIPTSKYPALRDGGHIVVYLGETEDYLNRQLRSGGYILRLPDWTARQAALENESLPLVFLHENYITPPGTHPYGIRSHRLPWWKPLLSCRSRMSSTGNQGAVWYRDDATRRGYRSHQ